jgi:hypothetical protein
LITAVEEEGRTEIGGNPEGGAEAFAEEVVVRDIVQADL